MSGGRSRCSYNIMATLGFQSTHSKEIRVSESLFISPQHCYWMCSQLENWDDGILQGEGYGKINRSCSVPWAVQSWCRGWALSARYVWGQTLLCPQEPGSTKHKRWYKYHSHDSHPEHCPCSPPALFPKQDAEEGLGEKGDDIKRSGWMRRFFVR